jgi:hypothetical protein
MLVITPQVSFGDQKSTDSHFLSVVYLQLLYLTLGFYLYVCVWVCVCVCVCSLSVYFARLL